MKPVMPEPLRLGAKDGDPSLRDVMTRLDSIEGRLHALETGGRRLGPLPTKPDLQSVEKRVVAALAKNVPAVDRSARVLVSGILEIEKPDYREPRENGQQQDYVVLTQEERAKGFVRPVRRSYVHQKCGSSTRMSDAIAETYARDPGFYSGTFCCSCRNHFPVGADGEFVWEDGTKVGT